MNEQETQQVIGDGISGGLNGTAKIVDGIAKVVNALGHGVNELARTSPKPKSGNTCFCNCRSI
ncbi:hypothetical protein CKA27_20515 [Vibrio coralliilyticus]|nr:hypothetical protein DVV14_25400 [Vibrio coralliilyticus]NOI30349.1 hypothetical protein [Vibrio coralliilyticus]NOI49937.1 hypothetical protein [Vibrio coralliilyticus]NOI59154.1 hypothetical protein [Vibrio coralliilyticus]PAT66208.1 hypothetical protein CKA27_20515 [Vibrio coralliilyticus]